MPHPPSELPGRVGARSRTARQLLDKVMKRWDFRQNAKGRWYWCCHKDDAITESVETFGSRISCIADALRHGLLDETGVRDLAYKDK
jgi:hypothetical protein